MYVCPILNGFTELGQPDSTNSHRGNNGWVMQAAFPLLLFLYIHSTHRTPHLHNISRSRAVVLPAGVTAHIAIQQIPS